MIELLKEDDIMIDIDHVEVRKLYKKNEGKNLLEIPEIKNLLKENDINISYIDENINVYMEDNFAYRYTCSNNIPRYPGVYIITFETEKIYIGSTVNLYNRSRKHLKLTNKITTEAMKKISIYATDNKEIVCGDKISYAVCEAVFLEKNLIKFLRPEHNKNGKPKKINGNYIANPHSCAVCKNRPIDFLKLESFYGEEIKNPEMESRCKIYYIPKKEYFDKSLEERIKLFGRCPKTGWKEREAFSFNEEKCFNSDKDAGYYIKWDLRD